MIRAGAAVLPAARGPYCRPSPKRSDAPAVSAEHREPPADRAGSRVKIDLKVPTRRLELTGICGAWGTQALARGRALGVHDPAGDGVEHRELPRHQAGRHLRRARPRRGVKAVFGFDLRLAG